MLNRRDIFFNNVAQTSDFPVAFEAIDAEGVYIIDKENNKYIDLISGISVSNIGHKNADVVNAIKTQADKYIHLMVYGEYIQAPQTDLAKKITSLLPKCLDNVYFVNSGSEAIEGAIKLAKRYTGRDNIVCFEKAYHGNTLGALSLIGNEEYINVFNRTCSNVKRIKINDELGLDCIDEETACVVVELIQGEAGVILSDKDYIKKLDKRCKEKGVLLIVDEIQTAFGRTGTFFAFEIYGILPDIITIAKAMGAGMPIGAFVSSKDIMKSLSTNPVLGHITTFGGNAMCCAAALANINYIIEHNLVDSVDHKADLFKQYLKHPAIKQFRNSGLLIAIEFEDEEFNFEMIKQCLNQKILTDWFLFNSKSMRIAPPLIISDDEIVDVCKRILIAIEATSNILKQQA